MATIIISLLLLGASLGHELLSTRGASHLLVNMSRAERRDRRLGGASARGHFGAMVDYVDCAGRTCGPTSPKQCLSQPYLTVQSTYVLVCIYLKFLAQVARHFHDMVQGGLGHHDALHDR